MEGSSSNSVTASPLGPLPSGWHLVRLQQITTKIGSGATPKGGEAVYLRERKRHALIRSQQVFDRWFDASDISYISDVHAHDLRNAEVYTGDILLNITGDGVTFGRACLTPERILPACVNQHVSIIRTDRAQCEPGFLLAYLTHPAIKGYIESFNAGGSRRAITKGHIESFEIPLPPLRIQQRIAEILGTLDDKIELNRCMNETLEGICRAMFKSWFVDFDPVRTKDALRRQHPKLSNTELSRRALPHLDSKIAVLFADSFTDSQIGPIPTGWQVVSVPEGFNVNPSRSLPRGTVAAYLEMADMPTQSARAVRWIRREAGSGARFVNGDTLVARITPCLENGKTAFVDFLSNGEVAWGSTEYIVIRPKSPLPPAFAYFLARTEEFRQHLIANMTGTSGRQRAPANCLSAYLLAVPDEPAARAFGEITDSLMARMKSNDAESTELAAARDILLPNLLSGQVGVHTSHQG